MRTYLIDADKNDLIIDLNKTIKHSSEMVEFEFSMTEECKSVNKKSIFIRKLANQLFASEDGVRWEKLAKQDLPKHFVNVDKVFDVYRGYKPSGLSAGGAGELFTQMPGKVVKILVKEGDQVEEGQPLLILEAMKMENEIKSGVTGTIKTIHVSEGQAIESGYLMLEVEE